MTKMDEKLKNKITLLDEQIRFWEKKEREAMKKVSVLFIQRDKIRSELDKTFLESLVGKCFQYRKNRYAFVKSGSSISGAVTCEMLSTKTKDNYIKIDWLYAIHLNDHTEITRNEYENKKKLVLKNFGATQL